MSFTSLRCHVSSNVSPISGIYVEDPLRSACPVTACHDLNQLIVKPSSPRQSQHVRLGLVHPRRYPPHPHQRSRLHLLRPIPRQTERSPAPIFLIIQSIREKGTTYRELSSAFGHSRLGKVEIPIAEGIKLTEWSVRTAAWGELKKRFGSR